MWYFRGMDGHRSIGGFFGLELPEYGNFPQWHEGRSVAVNSGRRALEYILRCLGDVRRVHVPRYTCATILEPMKLLGVPCSFYCIDERLELVNPPVLETGEYLLYANYFGIKEKYVDLLASRYGGRLIVDNALALYSPVRSGVSSFYSPRKFSGLSDGGVAVMEHPRLEVEERDESFPEASFLLECLEHGPERACAACERSERRLQNAPLRRMSRLTERLMRGIDYEQVRRRRMDNFLFLHERLGHLNRLAVDMDSLSGPFCYPFWTAFPELRNVLIDERILIPLLWPEVLAQAPAGSLERKLALHLLPLPVDQRCGPQDMERLARIVEAFYS
ncbi:hypothetical protein [uncultured Akkermansia sp.]|uniref:hypothetical protein n=1 Tax=uncultured Akkermansia sp. TaxID=512294 RepID=UPI00265D2FEA|nr:hypothetical protein [uncultured Akkermansia sp.]